MKNKSSSVALSRREVLAGLLSLGVHGMAKPFLSKAVPGFQLIDVTRQAGIDFRHNSGAYGDRFLPETMGPGCAFLDYDADGWQDILIVNGMDWPGHRRKRSTLSLYRNNRNGTFSDVTRSAGLDVEMYCMGVAAGDYNNDGFPDILFTCVGQNRLFRNTGHGTFVDATRESGLAGRAAFSTSALWFDYDRDGLLDLFVCNYIRWSPEHDVFCSVDGAHKSYCTPEAYRGETCWLFHNRGNGTFEDVTAGCLTSVPSPWVLPCSISTMTAGPILSSPMILSRISFIAIFAMARSRTQAWKQELPSALTEWPGPAWEWMPEIFPIPEDR